MEQGKYIIHYSHNDRQKIPELECVKRWLPIYNEVNGANYNCLRPNYFQNEVDVYVYREGESGKPLRLQLTKANFQSLARAIKRKAQLYTPEQKVDLLLLLDFHDDKAQDAIMAWQKKHLGLLVNSGFSEIWLVGYNGLIVNLWPGLT